MALYTYLTLYGMTLHRTPCHCMTWNAPICNWVLRMKFYGMALHLIGLTWHASTLSDRAWPFFIVSIFQPIYYLRPSTPAPSLVTQIRGHKSGSSHPSSLRCVPCIFIARVVQHCLPSSWAELPWHGLTGHYIIRRDLPRQVRLQKLHLGGAGQGASEVGSGPPRGRGGGELQ